MTQLAGSNVLVTGAGSGLGRAMSFRFARLGARVVAWDIDEKALARLAADMTPITGTAPRTDVVDVRDRRLVYETARRVEAEHGPIDVLVNNAGVVSGKKLLEVSDEQIERTMGVNTMALFWTTRAFLPGMLERNRGHLCTVASAAGLVGVSGLADYCASKWAAVGFDEAMRVELGKTAPGVHTTVVCPYFIDTGMFEGVRTRFPSLLPILAEGDVAERIVNAIQKDQARLIMPPLVSALPMIRALPVAAFDAICTFLGVNEAMETFVGRAPKGANGRAHAHSV
jgi:all-trans-retinol dehydrogenase (NAD+)